eukprot:CAMPEP_0201692940 /NCGR_PEP_ID=MMETSP0578-20130828/5700_1 /ASSEMBLY_ACC=CAM_ASM_000663 /TAXON_ID=267565 /ORGANISM="Skeletonema grethea, Strain CCMP 1804" /LENGTH=318 /DNA_ID=CAMNT_0048178397 /DNA_START=24 /DNA_END=980 /DNA_ORIENTATION=-
MAAIPPRPALRPFVRFFYTGEEDIPHNATHVFVYAKIIRARTFYNHPNIIEVVCHDEVEKIEEYAFCRCPSLRRVIMRGVKIVEGRAFDGCLALTDVECGKLEIIGVSAFCCCISLRSINLPSVRIVGYRAFGGCRALTAAKFGNELERFDREAFKYCRSLERITIPLKDGMITDDHIFRVCKNLKRIDLVEGEELCETIAALHFEEWREDMNEEITSINQNLPNADAGGGYNGNGGYDDGEKALVIRSWLRSVLDKIIHYQTEHQRVLDVAAATLELALPRDIAINNVLSFLELPPHTFGVEDREDAEGDDSGTEEE